MSNSPSTQDIFFDISKMLSRSIHDINNPFSVIIGQLSIAEILLSREELNLEKVKSSLQKMKSGTEKMQERKFFTLLMRVNDKVFLINWRKKILKARLQLLGLKDLER